MDKNFFINEADKNNSINSIAENNYNKMLTTKQIISSFLNKGYVNEYHC